MSLRVLFQGFVFFVFFFFFGCPAQELFFHVFCFIFLVSFQINVKDVLAEFWLLRVLCCDVFLLKPWALGSLLSLGGGFNDFLFSPRNPGEMIQFDEHIFQLGGSTTNQ